MAESASIIQQGGRLIVSGDLNFATVAILWEKSQSFLFSLPALDFDLSQVSSSNSAGLALLVEWIKYANRANKPIKFTEVPSQLKSILSASGMDGRFL